MKRVILFCLALSACARPNYAPSSSVVTATEKADACVVKLSVSQSCVSLDWLRRPTDDEFGQAFVKIWRPNLADGTPVPVDPGGDLEMTVNMPSMPQHGDQLVALVPVDVGTYRADKVFFIMAGAWTLHVKVRANATLKEEAVVPYIF